MTATTLAVLLAVAAPPDYSRKLTLHPAAEPVPALRYRLLPEERDRTPGNAAQLYYRAFSPDWWPKELREPGAKLSDARHLPLKDLPAEFKFVLSSPQLREVDRAARRAYCDWELTPRLREDGIGTQFPELQGVRQLAMLVALRSRYELAAGDFLAAARSLQTGFALGRHVADGPTLIQYLVGVAATASAEEQLEEWVCTPGSPNLYWAITELPQPFADLRRPIQGEQFWIDKLFEPFRKALADPKAPPPSAADALPAHKFLRAASGQADPDNSMVWTDLSALALAVSEYPSARAFLVKGGRPAAAVRAMPVSATVLMYQLAEYDRRFDDQSKWLNLPYPAAREALSRFDKQLGIDRASARPGVGLASMLLPSAVRVAAAGVRTDRRFAALRVVEAMRLHAAATGAWPDKLADITLVPVPDDPATGRPFQYTRDGSRATLVGPPADKAKPHAGNTVHFELTLTELNRPRPAPAASSSPPPGPVTAVPDPTAPPPEYAYKLTLRPAAEPVPALRYRLLPEERDRTPGNAAQLYYRAFSPDWWPTQLRDPKTSDRLFNARSLPPAELPSEFRFVLTSAQLKEVDRAARRAYCDWEVTDWLRNDPKADVDTLLAHLHGMRELARLVALRARYELAAGDFPAAARSLQTGFALSLHEADGPTFWQALGGVSVVGYPLAQVHQWIDTPDSPNLYWALAELPRPWADVRRPLEGERVFADRVFGPFRRALADPGIPLPGRDDAERAFRRLPSPPAGERPELPTPDTAARLDREAKQLLTAAGRSAAGVAALSAESAAVFCHVAEYDRRSDELAKWLGLPFPMIRQALRRAEEGLPRDPGTGRPADRWADQLLKAVMKTAYGVVRRDRHVAALRVLEAIRLYAAAAGRWPDALTDITVVPVPDDPETGNPFAYARKGDRATLFGPPVNGPKPDVSNSIHFRLTLTDPKGAAK